MICDNCSHNCDISEGGDGLCHARTVCGKKVVCSNYGKITSLALDPIEKKPLAMYHPGSKILSAGSYGCNMRCMWCQNDSISRGPVEADTLTCEELIAIAEETRARGNIGIAYTYNEPSVGYEFVLDCARLAKQNGLVNVMVTNGMLSRSRFDELLKYVDAYNIDLKSPKPEKYAQVGGDLDLILANIRSASEYGRHVELTTLVVPGFNDTDEDIARVVSLIEAIDAKIPLHITRFFPAGDMRDTPPTDLDVLYRFRDIAAKTLENVFLGNV
ncbi:MAG: radical SAM protein [Lachnospiraceae bacterium]|nr:radical SAM protein [Lachnospiraceae bacterium]